MALPFLSRADAAFGNAIEAAVSAKHRRRLKRLGWERALEPPHDGIWAAGDPPPRQGCSPSWPNASTCAAPRWPTCTTTSRSAGTPSPESASSGRRRPRPRTRAPCAHSLLDDTEMNVVTDDAGLARATRVRQWAEHLELDRETVAGADPVALVDDHWRPIAAEQLERRDRDLAPTHRLVALPGVSKRSRRILGPLEGLTDDG